MIPVPLKIRHAIPNDKSIERHHTEHFHKHSQKSKQIKQKLTRGKQKYTDIKVSYTKACDTLTEETSKECTFEPRVLMQSKHSNSRSFKKFIEDQ